MIPDAPWIRDAEMNGVGDPPIYCPCCGEDCETVYADGDGTVFACNRCVRTKDAWEWQEEMRESGRPDWADE